jgi:hypothetical protein
MPSVNIDIRVTRDTHDEHVYLVSATAARGRTVAQTAFRLLPEQWQGIEPSLQVLHARAIPAPREHVGKIRSFGQLLFDSLIQDEVRTLYNDKKREATRDSKVLRLQLVLVPLELVILPWELLFDGQQSEYLCLTQQPRTVLVRSLDHMRSNRPSSYDPPLRILGMTAEPRALDWTCPGLVESRKQSVIYLTSPNRGRLNKNESSPVRKVLKKMLAAMVAVFAGIPFPLHGLLSSYSIFIVIFHLERDEAVCVFMLSVCQRSPPLCKLTIPFVKFLKLSMLF